MFQFSLEYRDRGGRGSVGWKGQSLERMSEGIVKNGPAEELVLWYAQCGLSSLVI